MNTTTERHPPPELVAETFSRNVRAELVRRRMTYASLAPAVALTPRTVQAKLLGQRPLSLREAYTISRALGLSLDELVATPAEPAADELP
jgi:plasmid maintenance system antidote protein VapI